MIWGRPGRLSKLKTTPSTSGDESGDGQNIPGRQKPKNDHLHLGGSFGVFLRAQQPQHADAPRARRPDQGHVILEIQAADRDDTTSLKP